MFKAKTYSNKSGWLVRRVHEVIRMDDTNNVLEFVRPMLAWGSVPTTDECELAKLVDITGRNINPPSLTS